MTLRALFLVIILHLFSTLCADNRALLVGIGDYDTVNTGWSAIHGDKDIDMISDALVKIGYKQKNIKRLRNSYATKASIVKAMKELAEQCQPGDNVWFHFSGHGQPVSDLNGDERKKPFDEAIVPYDACRTRRYKINDSFYNGEKHLIDDEINHLLDSIKKKLGPKGYLFVSFDACFSEGLEMAKSMIEPEDVKIIGPIRGTADILRVSRDSKVALNPRPKQFSKGARMAVVSACRDNERNYEYRNPKTRQLSGSLSYCLLGLITSGLDIRKWERYFKNERYRETGIFMSEQHPTITVYR